MQKQLTVALLLAGIASVSGCATRTQPKLQKSAVIQPTAAAATQVLKLPIHELLSDKGHYRGKRIEVLGYYSSFFEHSVLTSREGQPSSEGLWVDPFRTAPGCKDKIAWVKEGHIRLIGRFEFSDYGSGHMGICPGEVTQLELFEKTP